jgi:hypothetical protein
MRKDIKKPYKTKRSVDCRNLTEEEYREKVAARHGISSEDIGLDPESGLVWFKARYEPETGKSINPMPLLRPKDFFVLRSSKFDPITRHMIEAEFIFQPYLTWEPKKKPWMIGVPLKTFADLVALTRTWRRLRHKKLRCLYVKDGSSVGYGWATSQAQDCGLIGFNRQGLQHLKDRIAALGADSVFMIHYCPAEDTAPPSIGDDLAAFCRETVPELEAHIIVYPASFVLILVEGINVFRVLPEIQKTPRRSALRNIHLSQIKTSPELSAWANALTGRQYRLLASVAEQETKHSLYGMRLRNMAQLGTYLE